MVEILGDFSIDAVIHFAAFACVGESLVTLKYYKNNLIGSIKLLNALSFSSKKTYPIPIVSHPRAQVMACQKCTYQENEKQLPIIYGNTVLYRKILKDYGKAMFSNISFRYFNASGASSDTTLGENHIPETHLIPLCFDATYDDKKSLTIYGNDYPTNDGTCIRDYIHVDDLARAHVMGLIKIFSSPGQLTQTYNLATGKDIQFQK